MKIEHVALWTADLERLRQFYERYFGAQAGPVYHSRRRPFSSYFLAFESGARLELMTSPQVTRRVPEEALGYAHLAISVGSRERVDVLAERLRQDGHAILSGPRETGDGYYEATVADPDGNTVEITV